MARFWDSDSNGEDFGGRDSDGENENRNLSYL